MQFSILLTSILATAAFAGPLATPTQSSSRLPTATSTPPNNGTCDAIEFHKNDLIFAAESTGCSFSSCWAVIKDGICIATAIAEGNAPGILACLGDKGYEQACSCASCIPGLAKFLASHGLCPS